jgi:hypothetical protein
MLLIKQKQNQIFSISIINIDKALHIKKITNPYTKLPKHYHQYLDIFDQRAADQLPPHWPEANHKIKLNLDKKGKPPEVPYGPLY